MVSTKLKLPMFYFNVRDFEEPRSQLFADVRKMIFKKGVRKTCAIVTGKHLCWSLF